MSDICTYMLFLKSWLSDYIDLSGIDDQSLADLISRRSSEVESVTVIEDYFDKNIVVGKILNIRQHPEVESLKYFDVEISNNKTTQIVSKATNVREGLIVPVALPGANFAGFTVSSKKLKGIDSIGVCLGKSELNLETEYSTGLWELNELVNDEDLGKSICEVFPESFPNDVIFDIKILPDKISKIGNHLGMSVEIATVLKDISLLRSYAQSITQTDELSKLTSKLDSLTVNDSENKINLFDKDNYCSAFAMFEVKLSKQFELNSLYRRRMQLLNENLTSTIADLSNYIQLDIGQPTHFFKTSGLKVNELEIAATNVDMQFNGLGLMKNTNLPIGTHVLKSTDSILAIPGISGNQDSSVSFEDTEVILELATFNQDKVSKNSFHLNYRSPAAKLYCSEVDQYCSAIAFLKLSEILGLSNLKSKLNYISHSNISYKTWLNGINKPLNKNIKIDYKYINGRIGTKNYLEKINSSLPFVGFVDSASITPFPIINLVNSQEDLIREVSRVIGYEELEKEFIPSSTQKYANNTFYDLIRIKELVASYGFYEIATRPFLHDKKLELIDPTQTILKLQNPYREGVMSLRSDLNITLLETLSNNIKDGFKDARLFEIGKAYYQFETRLVENNFLGLGLVGEEFNLITSILNDILKRTNQSEFSNTRSVNNIGSKTSYLIDNTEVASIIEVSNKVKKMFDLPLNKTVILLNITLPKQIPDFPSYKQYRDESQYPSMRRSYSLKVDKYLSTKTILISILKLKSDFEIFIDPIERIDYSGEDKLLLSIRYSSKDRTLTQLDINPIEEHLKTYEI
jgi:phenylalanyl-tRNA synthetase beta chain